MNFDPYTVYAIAALIGLLVLSQVFRRSFDPFEPVWLFLVGYAQVYVVQALSYREYALRSRGEELTAAANFRALWALVWFLAVYYSPVGKWVARRLAQPPRHWSEPTIALVSPVLIAWGLFCANFAIVITDREMAAEESLLHSFPFVMQVAGIWLLVTGRQVSRPRPAWTAAGLFVTFMYVLIWMFNGKRSHALFGVLTGVCGFYLPRMTRPSKPVLAMTACLGIMAVSLAIGWRGNNNYEQSFAGFFEFVGDYDPANVLVNINLRDRDEVDPTQGKPNSYETEEYGGFLLMMDTVPQKSPYDYGESYIRLVSTFIPRIIWHNKPYFGREKWVSAWIAGSEFNRDETFTGPAISVLGATQLNGGALGTFIMMAVLAIILRAAYSYFRLYSDVVWIQAWWALTYYNSWLMTVTDDPFVWFYYNYGFSAFLPLTGLWFWLKLTGRSAEPGAAWEPTGALGHAPAMSGS